MTGTGIKAEGAFEEICRMESLAESFKNPSSGDGQSGTHVLPWWKKMISDTITRWKQKSWHAQDEDLALYMSGSNASPCTPPCSVRTTV